MFEDNFEGYAAGGLPGEPWGARVNYSPASDTSRVSIVDSDSFSGSKSAFVSSPGSFNPTFIYLNFAPEAAQAEKLYVRMYMKASAGLGGDGGHAHIIELSQDGQNGIRYGEANGSIGVNTVEGGDPLSPQPGQLDEDLMADQWYCVEVLFDREPEYHELTTWIDDAAEPVHRVSNDEGQWSQIWTNNGPPANWLDGAFDNQIQFGWYAFSGVRGNDILFDDIVISTERVHCDYMPTGAGGSGVE